MTGTRLSAAARMMCLPTLVAPVKIRWSNASFEKAVPTSTPPVNTAISSSAKYLGTASANTSATRSVYSDGLIMARLPAANIPAIGTITMPTGKFQGAMTPTTPFGW